jgi:hypothetical protein
MKPKPFTTEDREEHRRTIEFLAVLCALGGEDPAVSYSS